MHIVILVCILRCQVTYMEYKLVKNNSRYVNAEKVIQVF